MRQDIYERITHKIVEDLERGVRPWHKPWSGSGGVTRPLRSNFVPYRGINILTLWMHAMENGFSASVWMTFKQAQELGGHVRKGERGAPVVFASSLTRSEINPENGEETEHEIPFMRGYTVFNVAQIEGLPERYQIKPAPAPLPLPRIVQAEDFTANSGAVIRHGGAMAFYSLDDDHVQMPPFETFDDPESYYGTLLHELTHWTRHKSRLDRDLGRKRFGDAGYAMEELVAELGSAFLCADLDIAPVAREENAAYIGAWLEVLKQDKRAVFSAAAYAQRAADYLHGLQKADTAP